MFDPENVVVRVGNKLDGVPDEVRATVEGITALSEGLITVGNRCLITSPGELRAFTNLINNMNASFGDRATIDLLNRRYGDRLDGSYAAVKKGLAGTAFQEYFHLGTSGTVYKLSAEDMKEEDALTLRIIGSTKS